MFSLIHGSRSKSVPIHLYRVVYGSGPDERLLLAGAEEDIAFDGEVYQVSQIKHADIHASGTLDRSALEVTVPVDNPLALLFRDHPPSQVVSLTIWRGDVNSPGEFLRIWSGRILSCNLEDYEAKLSGEPIGTAIRRPGLRRNYQVGCTHVLYGPSCRAVQENFTNEVILAGASASSILVELGWNDPWPESKFINGIATWSLPGGSKVVRTILRIQNVEMEGVEFSVIRLAGPAESLETGSEVSLSLGCNHQLSDCADVFHNAPNYGGCPWIPDKNPVGSFNPFY